MASCDRMHPGPTDGKAEPTVVGETEECKEDLEEARSADPEAGRAEPGDTSACAPPKPPPFRFIHLLGEIQAMVGRLPGFGCFICKYLLLQGLRLVAATSILFLPFLIGNDLDLEAITTRQYVVFGCFGAVQVLGRLMPFATKLIIDQFKEQLQAEQATAVVAKLFELQHDAMLSTPTGEFAQLIGKVYRNLDTLMPALYGAVIPMAVETAFAVCFIGVAYGPVSLILLALFCAYTMVIYMAAAQKAQRNRDMMMAFISQWGKIMATAASYERAHFFGNVKHEIGVAKGAFEIIGSRINALMSVEHRQGMCLTVLSLTLTAALMLLVPAVVNVSGLDFVSLAFYILMYVGSLDVYGTAVSTLRVAVFEYQAFHEFLGRKSEVKDADDAVELEARVKPSIEFRNVSFSYGGRVILDDVSFKVEGGQTVGLVGSSGCGKSTVLRLLLRFYRPTSGTILIDGHDIAKVSGTSLRELFSVVTQDAQLFNGSIRENIGYGRMGSSDEAIMEAASLAELDVGGAELPLSKDCGEKGAKLSGGQQQRVSLARAMLKKGTIYLLDEPTTGLDGVVAAQLQETLDKLSCEATTICITHHLGDLKHANHIVHLDQGRIIERGDFQALMDAKGAFCTQVEARNR